MLPWEEVSSLLEKEKILTFLVSWIPFVQELKGGDEQPGKKLT
jgi:hypothetical protein